MSFGSVERVFPFINVMCQLTVVPALGGLELSFPLSVRFITPELVSGHHLITLTLNHSTKIHQATYL